MATFTASILDVNDNIFTHENAVSWKSEGDKYFLILSQDGSVSFFNHSLVVQVDIKLNKENA